MNTADFLKKHNLQPVLVDVGASGETYPIWDEIASQSIYVGFDPDLREIREIHDGKFFKATMIDAAVTDDEHAKEVRFYLTESPYCSSTLQPDHASLSNFLYSNLFAVKSQTSAKATTLNAVLKQLNLSGIDWLKLDSQGTDLRLFKSLRSSVLAVDMEPGLIDAYQGEDLFPDVHREMIRAGFWLSNFDVKGTPRLRRSAAFDNDEKILMKMLKKTPGWCECRYLRTLDSLGGASRRDYQLLWCFALLDKQLGFAYDVALDYEHCFGIDEVSQEMKNKAFVRIQGLVERYRRGQQTPLWKRVARRVLRRQ